MSKKTIAFPVPASPAREPVSGNQSRNGAASGSDAWVSRREPPADRPAPAGAAPHAIMLDLTAERTLAEVYMLCLLVPYALGWFWLARAMAGRYRV